MTVNQPTNQEAYGESNSDLQVKYTESPDCIPNRFDGPPKKIVVKRIVRAESPGSVKNNSDFGSDEEADTDGKTKSYMGRKLDKNYSGSVQSQPLVNSENRGFSQFKRPVSTKKSFAKSIIFTQGALSSFMASKRLLNQFVKQL